MFVFYKIFILDSFRGVKSTSDELWHYASCAPRGKFYYATCAPSPPFLIPLHLSALNLVATG